MDNIDFAVLSKIEELGNRFGLKPYELIATLDHTGDGKILGMGVRFEIQTDFTGLGDGRTEEMVESRANAMLKAIGVDEDKVLGGGVKAVIDALDAALLKAPRPLINRPNP